MPVHPADYHLLGIRWKGKTYVDRVLPFGLRSAPKIFSAVADVVACVFTQMGIPDHLHYLDDFGGTTLQRGAHALDIALWVLGVPVAAHKTEGPSTVLAFLGILVDTGKFELRLPADKLARLQETLQSWSGKRSCTRKELESLLGQLSHAATVIKQGRTFLRLLFPLLSLDSRLNAGARADLLWWRMFLRDWNGTSFFPALAPSVEVVSDASGSYGCGAFSLAHSWFQIEWTESWQSMGKELAPIVVAAALWGHQWRCSCVRFRSDNMAVVSILKDPYGKTPVAYAPTALLCILRGIISVPFHIGTRPWGT